MVVCKDSCVVAPSTVVKKNAMLDSVEILPVGASIVVIFCDPAVIDVVVWTKPIFGVVPEVPMLVLETVPFEEVILEVEASGSVAVSEVRCANPAFLVGSNVVDLLW